MTDDFSLRPEERSGTPAPPGIPATKHLFAMENPVIMQTLHRMLTRRNYQVPSDLPPFEAFQVSNPAGETCLVRFFVEGKAGVSIAASLIDKMVKEGIHESVLVTEGLTPQASARLNATTEVFICVMPPQSLMFDVCDHKDVPKHRILNAEENRALRKKYDGNLPVMGLNDPVAKYMGARPGDVFEIVRIAPNVGEHLHYRQVVKLKDRKPKAKKK
jgi:DNA-directed RNA polymerase subunit H (RpoH/RPB5)